MFLGDGDLVLLPAVAEVAQVRHHGIVDTAIFDKAAASGAADGLAGSEDTQRLSVKALEAAGR